MRASHRPSLSSYAAARKVAEGCLHFVTAVPQERDANKNRAASAVGMTTLEFVHR
jgi:hypothetical protein